MTFADLARESPAQARLLERVVVLRDFHGVAPIFAELAALNGTTVNAIHEVLGTLRRRGLVRVAKRGGTVATPEGRRLVAEAGPVVAFELLPAAPSEDRP